MAKHQNILIMETLYRFVKASERHPPEYGKMYIFRRISSGKLYIRLNTASPKGLIRRFTDDIEWLELLPAAQSPQKEEADEFYPGHRYQRIFDYLYSGGLTLLQSEMDDLIQIVRKDFPPEPVDTEAVEFAEFIRNLNAENGHDGDWHVPTNNESVDRVLSSKSLYNLFKQSK